MRLTVAFALSLFAVAGHAKDVSGVAVDDAASVAGADLVLNGAGVRTKVFFKVYVASLYTPAKAKTADAVIAKGPRRIQLNMLRVLEPKTLVLALDEGLTNNNSADELAAIKPQHDKLVAAMTALPTLQVGDVVTFDFADGATTLALNGKGKGSFAGAAFNAAILKVWLGAKPVQDDLKKLLLGG